MPNFFDDAINRLGGALEPVAGKVYPYHEVMIDTPITLTPTTVATSVIAGRPYKWVLSFIIRVRAMGTATFIRFGNVNAQTYSCTIVGQTIEWAGYEGQVVDLSKLFVISDTANATLELIAEYLPMRLYGLVDMVGVNE